MRNLLSLEQASKVLNVSSGTLRYYVKSGLIPYVKIGKHIRICESRLEQWANEKEIKQQQD